jgi:hypothetical protein
VGGVSKNNWGGTVKRPSAKTFQPPENKLVSEQPSAHATNSFPHHSIPPLHAKQYSKLTKTPNNAEYNVPKNSPSIKQHHPVTRCPSKSKIRNFLNLRCPKCPSHSNGHFGHPLTKNSPSLTQLITNASNFLVQNNRIMEKQKGKEVNQKTLVAFNQKIEVLTGRLQTK